MQIHDYILMRLSHTKDDRLDFKKLRLDGLLRESVGKSLANQIISSIDSFKEHKIEEVKEMIQAQVKKIKEKKLKKIEEQPWPSLKPNSSIGH
jgi:hypothetical protein